MHAVSLPNDQPPANVDYVTSTFVDLFSLQEQAEKSKPTKQSFTISPDTLQNVKEVSIVSFDK